MQCAEEEEEKSGKLLFCYAIRWCFCPIEESRDDNNRRRDCISARESTMKTTMIQVKMAKMTVFDDVHFMQLTDCSQTSRQFNVIVIFLFCFVYIFNPSTNLMIVDTSSDYNCLYSSI